MKLRFTQVVRTLLATVIVMLWLTAPSRGDEAADLVLYGGKIYTVNPAQPWAEAVAAKEGKIVFVGSDREANTFVGPETRTIFLDGRLMLPGLHDVHMHPLEAGSDAYSCILDSTQSLEKHLLRIKGCLGRRTLTDPWLIGWGHSIFQLIGTEVSPKRLLDRISLDRPIVMMEETSHSAWVNQAVLDAMQIDRSTPDPVGGVIVKDRGGEPTGLLLDGAAEAVFNHVFETLSEDLMDNHYRGLQWSLGKIRRYGITSIADARVHWRRGDVDIWKRLQQKGKLTVRTVLGLWVYPDMDDARQLSILRKMYRDEDDELLRITQIKMYSDGITLNRTAAMLAPYQTDIGLGLSIERGLNYLTEDRIAYYTTHLEKVGFDMHIHTIGDRGVREGLNAIERAMAHNGKLGRDRRHRLTHVEYVDPTDVPRFKALGVIADAQVAGVWSLPQNRDPLEVELLGESRTARHIPLRELIESDATLTLSSDWDVSTMSPFVAMMHALSRGDQSVPELETVIRAYTINGAYALRQEEKTGSIAVGKYADLVVLDQNLFEVEVPDIARTQAVLTILGGKIVFQR